jgi:hypothetical protein
MFREQAGDNAALIRRRCRMAVQMFSLSNVN